MYSMASGKDLGKVDIRYSNGIPIEQIFHAIYDYFMSFTINA